MIGERLVVERRYLDPPSRAIERDRLGENVARLDVPDLCAARERASLERFEQVAAEPEPARLRVLEMTPMRTPAHQRREIPRACRKVAPSLRRS